MTVLGNLQSRGNIFIDTGSYIDHDRTEIVNKHVSRVLLSDQDHRRLSRIYEEAFSVAESIKQRDHLAIAEFLAQKMTTQVPEFSNLMKELLKPQGPSAIFIENLPPLQNDHASIVAGELLSLSFAFLLGEPFQYMQQNAGRLVARITPVEGYEDSQSGLNRGHFGWHTDDRLFHETLRTEWIQLLGVHNANRARTILATIDSIVAALPPQVLRVLMEERFEVKMPTSFGFDKSIWSEPIALIWLNANSQFEVGVPTYNTKTVDPKDEEALEAFSYFLRTIDSCAQSVTLTETAMLVFNNNRLLHGRTPIQGDRLVLRTYIRRDLNELRKKTGAQGSVFDARFLL